MNIHQTDLATPIHQTLCLLCGPQRDLLVNISPHKVKTRFMFFTKQWSTTGDFFERDTNIRGEHLIIHHWKNVQKYLIDSSDCWRVENNLSQTEIEHLFEEQYSLTNRHRQNRIDCRWWKWSDWSNNSQSTMLNNDGITCDNWRIPNFIVYGSFIQCASA